MSLFQYNLAQNNSLYNQQPANYLSSPNMNDPQQTSLYFQQKFSDILGGFFNASTSSESDSLMGSDDSSTDMFGSSNSDPFAANTNLQMAQMGMLQNQYFSSGNMNLLNQAAALIGKEAVYSYNGNRYTGVIQSVLNNNGVIQFKIDDRTVPMDGVAEVKGGKA